MSTQYLNSNLKVFSLNSNKELAEQIAKHIGVGLGKCSVDRFSDGEVQESFKRACGCSFSHYFNNAPNTTQTG